MAQSAHNRYALGVDIGGSHVCSAVVDLATGQLCGEPHTDKVDAAAGAFRQNSLPPCNAEAS